VKRSANVDALYQVIADAAPRHTTAEWLKLLNERDIPCGPVNSLSALFEEPHLKEAGLFAEVAHPSEGALLGVRSPFRVTDLPPQPDQPAPGLGEGTQSILLGAGFGPEKIRDLIARNVVKGRSGGEPSP
jgi:crotonobetainyl-CoA:carnitine CoA-transferase CaiB-like acyl-CoA transferase